jgi:hypothetical protein
VANFVQFLNSHKRGETKRAYWVCGPVRRLVEETVDLVVHRIGADPFSCVRLTAGETSDKDIWAALNQYPSDGPRMIVVREAEKMMRWSLFAEWWGARDLAESHALFVSSEESTDTSLDHVHLIVSKGKFVKCGPFSPPSKKGQKDARMEVLKAHAAITDPAARLLILRTRGDMDRALDFLNKCKRFQGVVDERVVKAIVEVAPADTYVESLIAFKGRDAFEALSTLPITEYSSVIGYLDYQLDCLFRLYRAMRRADNIKDRSRWTREVLKNSRLESWQVARLSPYARRYDPGQVRTCIEALALADSKVADGETDLVMEVMTALWLRV